MQQIVIIGGGIAGLSAAIALRKLGYEPTIYEAAPEIKPVGAGIVLAFNAIQACRQLGIEQEIQAAGKAIEQAVITTSKGRVLSSMQYQKYKHLFGDVSVAIHRPRLHQVLMNHLPPHSIKTGKRVQKILQHSDHVLLQMQDGEEVESRYVIAADGIHSVIRQHLLPEVTERYSGYTCWRGIGKLPAAYPHGSEVMESWGAGQRLGIVPLTDDMVYWFAVKDAPQNDPEMKRASKKDLLEFFRGWDAHALSVLQNTPEEQIFQNDLCDIAPLSKFAFGDILLIGDAAHATTPNMGQGGCQALEDAAVLMDCVAQASSIEEAFILFEKRRVARTAKIITMSRTLGRIAHWSNPVLTGMRNLALRLTPEKTTVKQLMWLKKF